MAVEIKNLTSYPKNPRAGYTVILEVSGPAADVHTWLKSYLQEYHPCGYGTWVADRNELPGGRLRLTIRRSDSRD